MDPPPPPSADDSQPVISDSSIAFLKEQGLIYPCPRPGYIRVSTKFLDPPSSSKQKNSAFDGSSEEFRRKAAKRRKRRERRHKDQKARLLELARLVTEGSGDTNETQQGGARCSDGSAVQVHVLDGGRELSGRGYVVMEIQVRTRKTAEELCSKKFS